MNSANIITAVSLEFDSDSSDSSDEEVFDMIMDINQDMSSYLPYCRIERNCIKNFIENVVSNYTDNEFIKQFRLGPSISHQLIKNFKESDCYKNLLSVRGRQPLSAEKHILSFLYFMGYEAGRYRAVNNIFDISISSLHAVIKRVAEYICTLGPSVIKWPNKEESAATKAYFLQNKKFPNVIGLIGSSHIKINKPINYPESYINPKGNFSIQIQGIVDHNKKFIDIFIGYPGSAHESQVFKNSSIHNRLKNICEDGFILGNNAYPLSNYLLTPFEHNNLNHQQKYYNEVHSSTRIQIEETFSNLKQRFRQLNHLMIKDPKLIVQIIKSCCILHNLADLKDLDVLNQEATIRKENIDEYNNEICVEDTEDGLLIRNEVCEKIWSNK